jgi:anti-anti-sigma factor
VDCTITVDDTGSLATVTPSGDLDLATTPDFAEVITRALTMPGIITLVIDLSDVGFLDSSGISELLRGRRGADEQGVTFRVTNAAGMPLQALELTGVWAHLTGGDAAGSGT